jgi:transposase InsO family protein
VSAVLDCFNGEIVGLAMDDNMHKKHCIQAFENACKARNARSMIFHSDRGSQLRARHVETPWLNGMPFRA